MSIDNIPIADRTFTVDGHNVICRFFRPEPDGQSFRCRYDIHWPEGVRTKSAGGADEVQALILAMVRAHVDLLSARENDGREVSHENRRSLGLPVNEALREWDADNHF